MNSAWNIYNFRLGLIANLINRGYDVVVIAPPDYCINRIESTGCKFVSLSFDNETNLFSETNLFMKFLVLLYREKPNFFLGFTIKPNIYGSLAAHILGISVINNITGLGRLFIKKSLLTYIALTLYKLALLRSKCIFFQNRDDRSLFLTHRIVNINNSKYLPGSGVDLKKFIPKPFQLKKQFRFLLMARLLLDKGVKEFVDAARILKKKGFKVDCCLLGFIDVDNPSAISRDQIEIWVSEGVVRYLGQRDDVREEICNSDCIVLPSYREGTPKSLLEASAMGRPIVTTDAEGCRDVVDENLSGFLCRVGDAIDLADKMEKMIRIDFHKLKEMGLHGRKKIKAQYDQKIIFEMYANELDNISYELNL